MSYNTVVAAFSIEYKQPMDTCCYTVGNTEQLLQLSVESPDANNKFYYVMQTDRWAFDTPEELIAVLSDFINKLEQIKGTEDEE